jgi:E3 ubiquitin-protein ligase UBR1
MADAALPDRLESGPHHTEDNGGTDSTPPVSSMKDLVDIYRRLRDTMALNELPTAHSALSLDATDNTAANDFCASDTLAQSLGFSISAVEIQQRGVDGSLGSTYLDSIPQQSLTHMRILSETAASYVSIGGIKSAGDNRVSREFCQDYERQYYQLFLNDPYRTNACKKLNAQVEPLLSQDIFVFLTECSLCLAPVDDIDIMNIVRLCYLAEMVKVVIRLGHSSDEKYLQSLSSDEVQQSPSLAVFCDFAERVWRGDGQGDHEGTPYNKFGLRGMEFCRNFVQTYVQTFLRKVVLLLHVRYGISFQTHISTNPNGTELERLTEALRLPSFDEMCSYIPDTDAKLTTSVLVDWWIEHNREYYNSSRLDLGYDHSRRINVGHPAIFELIGLPKNYDAFMEAATKKRCATTGKDVSDPMLCLFCGEIFCGQSVCCLKEGPARPGRRAQKIGGAQQHMLK